MDAQHRVGFQERTAVVLAVGARSRRRHPARSLKTRRRIAVIARTGLVSRFESQHECDDYLDGRRIVAKPAITNSKVSISIAEWESVGIVAAALGIEVQVGTVIVFASVVTVPPNARALPVRFAKCPTVIPAASRIFPENVGVGDSAALGPSVVAPTGTQNTSEAQAPLVKRTLEFAPVVSAPPGRKM